MTSQSTERRISGNVLMEHWDSGVPVVIRLAGTPELTLRVDSSAERLTLRAPVDPSAEIPINTLANVRIEPVVDDGRRWVEISTIGEDLISDGYAMLMMIADRVQLGDAHPLEAFAETLSVWESILASRARLGAGEEIGLFGELLVLEGLLNAGTADAGSWRGGLREEHDFGFGKTDVEVKTTSGESRRHWIHGLGQLQKTDGSRLWLLSVQITRGGDTQGRTLPELIDVIVGLSGPTGEDRVMENLAGAGWHETQRDLYPERWRLRNPPLLLRVEGQFPRLTRDLLSEVAVDTTGIRQVDYEIDLTGLPTSPDTPPEMTEALTRMDEHSDG
jgi:Putative  PD-(D/E)XK family member, (DUF4420)